ncbi:MAG TPA: Na+/H+ antiporter subunit E [Sulfurovum sp.]|uniref:Na+/H+ antiporter subunit E n=1 Tax=Sulfurovum sp. TaxID=1969726 RepID=UPI002F929FEE
MNTLKLFGLYLLLWVVISGGRIALFPLLFILLMSFLTPYVFTLEYRHISVKAALKLCFWFLLYSLKGGVQVALFALRPKLRLEPFVYRHSVKSDNAFSVAMLANLYSLMPGTVSMGYNQGVLSLHILDRSLFDPALIQRLEAYAIEAFEGGTVS